MAHNSASKSSSSSASEAKPWDKQVPNLSQNTFVTMSSKMSRAMLHQLDALRPLSAMDNNKEAQSVIEVGCGLGVFTAELISEYGAILPPGTKITTTDYSTTLVEQVQKLKSSRLNAGETSWNMVEPVVADAMHLSQFPDETFSHYGAAMVLFMVPDPSKALSEARRVLKAGGALALSAWEGNDWMEVAHLAQTVDARFKLPEMIKPGWDNVDGVKSHLEKAGFESVDAERLEVYMDFKDPQDVMDMIERMPFMAEVMKSATDEERTKTRKVWKDGFMKKMEGGLKGRLIGRTIVAWARK